MLTEGQYKQRSMTIFGGMETDAWKSFESDIQERKEALMERMTRQDSLIEVEGFNVSENLGTRITVVALNKDPVRYEYKFLCELQSRIRGWKETALGVIKENSK